MEDPIEDPISDREFWLMIFPSWFVDRVVLRLQRGGIWATLSVTFVFFLLSYHFVPDEYALLLDAGAITGCIVGSILAVSWVDPE